MPFGIEHDLVTGVLNADALVSQSDAQALVEEGCQCCRNACLMGFVPYIRMKIA